ncbi:sulfotransferase family protein [Sphaerisporangium sp. B11E5]|uniref:sulfotransferase family protein n=1 Tax=Sphaerisporangium sp. B11E5 TaxID=3153563 RepID=UPI00325D3E3E
MLSVIGAGFPRTGTSSMKAALERLGFGPCHHMFDVGSDADRARRWAPLADPDVVPDWDQVFEGFRSAVDWPASFFWRELAAWYPEAKVVLTVRDPYAWIASMQTLIANGPARLQAEKLAPEMAGLVENMQTTRPLLERMIREGLGSDRPFGELLDEKDSLVAFERHVATVKESLPPERLLVFDVREGWEPLCRFLGVDVPAGEPFPHLNDSKVMQESIERLMQGENIGLPFHPAG